MSESLTAARVVAIQIVHCRRLLTCGFIARTVEDRPTEERMLRAFQRAVNVLPLALRVNAGDERRIAEPARRRMLRVGVLASRDWAVKAL